MNYDENKRMTLEEVKKVELQLLITFHDFCEKHKLKYVLDGGTLLGAVRHKGFIPWDDDIDVTMPFPDFLKFVKEYRSECDNSDKKILYGDDGYGFHFGKFVDIRLLMKRASVMLRPLWATSTSMSIWLRMAVVSAASRADISSSPSTQAPVTVS